MNNADAYNAFLDLAEDLFVNRKGNRELAKLPVRLPPITSNLLDRLGNRAEELANRQPRHAWAIAKVAYGASVEQRQDLRIRSLAAWYLGRACNHWGQPRLVTQAISQARRGFLKLNELAWIAACDWQFYALPWTRPNIPQTVRLLKHAATNLQRASFQDFATHCRLALAYAQILSGDFRKARRSLRISEAAFLAAGDLLNQARCWQYEANRLRRKDRIDQAVNMLHRALTVFETEESPVDIAKAHYHLGLCHLIWAEDLTIATKHFQRGIELFTVLDMDLWKAQCVNNLGFVYLLTGALGRANTSFEQARKSFRRHDVLGLLADNLNDHGKLNNLRGRPAVSIEQFNQARRINELPRRKRTGYRAAKTI